MRLPLPRIIAAHGRAKGAASSPGKSDDGQRWTSRVRLTTQQPLSVTLRVVVPIDYPAHYCCFRLRLDGSRELRR
jgi:hypothetical protein